MPRTCPTMWTAALQLAILSVASLLATPSFAQACTDYGCIAAKFYGPTTPRLPVALRDISVDVVGCPASVNPATCTEYSGGPLLFDGARYVQTSESLCCAYRKFAAAANRTDDPAAAPAAIATVADRLLSDESVGVGGIPDVLVDVMEREPPLEDAEAPLALSFTRSDDVQPAAAASFSSTEGTSTERVAIRVRTDGATDYSMNVNLTWSAAAAGSAKAYSVHVLFRCSPGTPKTYVPIGLNVTTSVPGGAPEVEAATAYCGESFAVGPILAPGREFTLEIARADGTLLPNAVHTLMALPVSADVIVQPTSPEPQDWRQDANATVLFLCPAGTIQEPSTVSLQIEPHAAVPADQRTMAGLTLYSFAALQTYHMRSIWIGVPPNSGSISQRQAQGQIFGGRASIARVHELFAGPAATTSQMRMHGDRMRCTPLPNCSIPEESRTPTYNPDNGMYSIPMMPPYLINRARGLDCGVSVVCPAGTQDLMLRFDGSYPMIRFGGTWLPTDLRDGSAQYFGSVPRNGPGGAMVFELNSNYWNYTFTAYPQAWDMPGMEYWLAGRYNLTYSPMEIPVFSGNVTCTAQPRCPTVNATNVVMQGGSVARFGVPDGVAWPADSSCEWRVLCATGPARIQQDTSVGLSYMWDAVSDWAIHDANSTVTVEATVRSTLFGIGFIAHCPATPSESITLSLSETLSITVSDSLSDGPGAGGDHHTTAPAHGLPSTTLSLTSTLSLSPTSARRTAAIPAPPVPTVPPSAPGNATPATPPANTTLPPNASSTQPGTTLPPPTPTDPNSTASGAPTAPPPSTTAAPPGSLAPPSTGPGVATTTSGAPTSPPSGPVTTTTAASPGSPVPPPPTPPGSGRRTRTLSLTLSLPLAAPVGGLVGGAAGDAGFLGTGIGGTVLAAAVGVFIAICVAAGLFLYRRWRRRRRSGDAPEPLAAPLRDRTNTYRWYEDAAAVAQDIEQRGDDVQTHDTEGALFVPSLVKTVDAAKAGPNTTSSDFNTLFCNGDLSFGVASGSAASVAAAASAAPTQVQPPSGIEDDACGSNSSLASTVVADRAPGNPLRSERMARRTSL